MAHVIECSVGVDRLFITLLCDAYTQDTIDGEIRTVLKLAPAIAPIKAAFLPLTQKLSEPMKSIYNKIKKNISLHNPLLHIEFDETGSIGKRYRRYDEIGTPLCFTYDFESEQDQKVTVRDRDTLEQTRISIEDIADYIRNLVTK